MELELGDQLLEILVEVLELAVAQLGDLGAAGLLLSDLEDVGDLAGGFGLVVDDLGLEVDHGNDMW